MDSLAAHILIIENEITIAHNLSIYLTESGFTVDHAYDGESALYRLSHDNYDAALLDLGLPKKEGTEVLRRLRQDLRLDLPVIVVSGRVEEYDKIQALNDGADDYITKPFSMAELVARLHSHLIRSKGLRVDPIYECGALRYDPKKHDVQWRSKSIKLPPKALKLFAYLISRPNQVISKQELEQLLAKDSYVDHNILRGQIHILRKELTLYDCPALETHHSLGYKLTPCY